MNKVVLALGDGKFKSIKVQIGRSTDSNIEILDGLMAGEEVVTSAQFLIDSESSISSDFNRISHAEQQPSSVWVEATIDHIMADHQMLTITHQPIADWDWPVMTMDLFTTDDFSFAGLSAGLVVHIEITKQGDSAYVISNVHIPDGTMSGMDHSTMDHGEMDHSTMNHGDMDDSAMAQQVTDQAEVKSASVNGLVNSINLENKTINISRDAIEKWGREADTMDFVLSEELNLEGIEVGSQVHFTFFISDDFDFIVTEITPLEGQHHQGAH
jgi:Cu(I)/Ag(I) efflux system membrane fusion protein